MKLHSGFTWFIFIVHLIVCNAWQSWITNTTILEIKMEQETDPVFPMDLNYTGYIYIMLRNPKLNVLTTEMQSTISTMANFSAWHGRINSAHLMAQFSFISIYNCSTSEVVINPNWTYKTDDLSIVYGNLAKLPKHLNVLKNLEKLYLHDNKIEFVEMAEFNGLNKLKLLSLQDNKIVEIRATLQNPVVLPKLEIFSVSGNLLVDVSFEHWNATSLKDIWLCDNQLQIALSFPDAFPALSRVIIKNNPFNCQWLTSTVKELNARGKLTIYYENETKCDKNGPPHDELVRRVKFKETFATIPFLDHSQSKLEEDYKNRMTHLEAINQNVTANIAQLQRQNVSLHNSYTEMQANLSSLSANMINFQKEVKNMLMQITNEATTHEQQMNATLKNLELAINSTHLESNKNYNLLHIKDEALEAQLKSFSVNQDLELVKLRQQMATLENERKADHQKFTENSAYGGIFKLERYFAIFVVLGVFGFLYLLKLMVNFVKSRQQTGGREICMIEVPVASFMDNPQQTREHNYTKSLSHHV